MTTIEQNKMEQTTANDEVVATDDHSTDAPPTTATQPAHDDAPSSNCSEGRSRVRKSAYTSELPLRQFVPDNNRSTTSSKSRTTAANGTNPAAIFCDARSSSVLRPPPYRARPTDGRTGAAAGRTSRAVSGQSVISRQRSPWRASYIHKDTEVDRSEARKRCLSVSPDVHRRPVQHSRAASTSRVRRTKSVPATSSTPADRKQTSPVTGPSSGRDCDISLEKIQPTSNCPPRASRPVVPVFKLTATTPDLHESVTVTSRPRSRRFLLVLSALCFIVIAVLMYAYVGTTFFPSADLLSAHPAQPSQDEPSSSSEINSVWAW